MNTPIIPARPHVWLPQRHGHVQQLQRELCVVRVLNLPLRSGRSVDMIRKVFAELRTLVPNMLRYALHIVEVNVYVRDVLMFI